MRLLVFLFILFESAQAQDAATAAVSDVIHLPKITEPITVDGRLDEPVWSRLESLPLTDRRTVVAKYTYTFRW